ncbi:MAG: NAD-dependent epimerase/dehydratase family protein [Bacteroidales bacterium]|jgi:nucleoside-diphosphate-sugar epimerase|nr:NAD-dependent epimerase/dehydratase family protein [Bacteroidales bacterium]
MNKPKILVTGGSGFLGSNIVKEFLQEDAPLKADSVRVLDLKAYKGDYPVDLVQGDIRDYEIVKKACEGVDAVVHAAAVIDWGTHPASYVYDVNVKGTENVIKACKELGIRYMVFTSSLDAIYTGKPLRNIDDSQPYPTKFHNMYCQSKVLGELMVKEANGKELKTTILRPSDIYGPADPYHMNALIGMAKTGFYVRLGNGTAKAQQVFAGNMAYAHVKVLSEIMNGNKKPLGEAYLITDAEGQNFFRFFDQIVEKAGYSVKPGNMWLPWGIAYSLGAISEFFTFLLRPIKKYNPGLSRFAVNYTCTDFTFNSKRAEEDFGFKPKYSEEEAIEITASYYRR